ncbi:MAG: trigger factor [Epsilonproteobacteria bacterium]|jgi:trigger factor|nr:trigger factor [Campylobacterota bacterium]NPA89308.1 trigger factor [Campylobacterota bacterium]
MDLKVSKIDSANYKIEGIISGEELAKEKKKIAKEWAKKVKLDGFRPGKVPVALVEKMYGAGIEEEALQKKVEEILKEANPQIEGRIVGNPVIKKLDRKDNGDLEVEIVVGIEPQFEVGTAYKECIPQVELPQVSEEEIQRELERIQEEMGEWKVVTDKERELKEGDTAIIDFVGYVNGEPFEGGSAEGYGLKIGSGAFIDGFEEQLKGMKVGETRTIEVKFPENYHASELAGQPAKFEVTLQEIQELKKGELNDELAQKYLNNDKATLEELKEVIKNRLLDQKKGEIYRSKWDEILECWLEKYQIDVPEEIVEQELENIINTEASQLSPAELEELRKNPEKIQQLKEKYLPEARDRVRLTFILSKLIETEGIKVDDNEILSQIYYEALLTGQDYKALYQYYKDNNLLPVVQMEIAKAKLLNALLEEKNGTSGEEKNPETDKSEGESTEKGESSQTSENSDKTDTQKGEE